MSRRILLTTLLAASLAAPGAMALGSDITVWDGNSSASPGWWNDPGPTHRENNETEPGTISTDAWDLEGFFLDTSANAATLSLVGTYDFLGFAGNATRRDEMAGDLFIAGAAVANGSQFEPLLGGIGGWYLDMDWANASGGSVGYSIFAFTGAEYTGNQTSVANGAVYEGGVTGFVRAAVVDQSGPWRGEDIGTLVGAGAATLAQISGVADRLTRSDGSLGIHNVVEFDWEMIASQIGLGAFDPYTVHFIQSCGNDAVYGSTGTPPDDRTPDPLTPVPEPASLALLGIGLLGITMRRRFKA